METVAFCVVFTVASVLIVAKLFPRRFPSELPSPEVRYKHQAEYQEALDEIERLDANVATLLATVAELSEQKDEAIQSAEHWQERLKTSEEIRQKLAASLSGRCCGGQITMGNTEAKIVHGSVVVSDPDDGFPHQFAKQVAEVLDAEEAQRKANRKIIKRGGPFDEKDDRFRHAIDPDADSRRFALLLNLARRFSFDPIRD